MTYKFATIIVTAEVVEIARAVAAQIDPAGSTGLWTTPLSPTGDEDDPITHYVISGQNDERVVDGMKDANALYASLVAAASEADADPVATLAQCEALVAGTDDTDEEPFVAMARLGLLIVSPDEV